MCVPHMRQLAMTATDSWHPSMQMVSVARHLRAAPSTVRQAALVYARRQLVQHDVCTLLLAYDYALLCAYALCRLC
jgi:hypothetical protein